MTGPWRWRKVCDERECKAIIEIRADLRWIRCYLEEHRSLHQKLNLLLAGALISFVATLLLRIV